MLFRSSVKGGAAASMADITLDTVVSRGAEHVEAQMAGQTVMMSIPRGKYFAVEGTGQRIWELMAEPVTVGEIVDRLVEEYDVDRDRCAGEVINFLGELLQNGLTLEQRP